MKQQKKKSPIIITVLVLLFFVLLAGGFAYLISSDRGGGGKKVFIAKVDLVRPNLPDRPPPPPREKLPEPEAQKQNIVAPPLNTPQGPQQPAPKGDDKPAPQGPLGLEGEGGAGSDGFGLVGRGRGGRDVITLGAGSGRGGADQAALARRFGWYTRIVGEELNKLVRKHLEENGGIPKGTLEVEVRIELDEQGAVTGYRIIRSSGNQAMDDAVKALKYARIGKPLPKGIYSGMNYKITSR
ncbi:MAG: TonB family protein [Syntrophorhabdales bacterium]|jgi:TonB family protein